MTGWLLKLLSSSEQISMSRNKEKNYIAENSATARIEPQTLRIQTHRFSKLGQQELQKQLYFAAIFIYLL